MQLLKFWILLLAAAVLAGTATRQFFAGADLDGAMSVLGAAGWFVLALRNARTERSDAEILHAGDVARTSLRGVFAEANARLVERRNAAWNEWLNQLRQSNCEGVVSVTDTSDNKKCKARIILSNHREATLRPMIGGKLEVRWSGADWQQGQPCADIAEVAEVLTFLAARN